VNGRGVRWEKNVAIELSHGEVFQTKKVYRGRGKLKTGNETTGPGRLGQEKMKAKRKNTL